MPCSTITAGRSRNGGFQTMWSSSTNYRTPPPASFQRKRCARSTATIRCRRTPGRSVRGRPNTDTPAQFRRRSMPMRNARALVAAAALSGWALALVGGVASAAKTTECTKINVCYCVDSALRPAVDDKVARARQLLADQRKAGKLVGYMSVPLSPAGGGNFDLNREVASEAADPSVQDYGHDQVVLLIPKRKHFHPP